MNVPGDGDSQREPAGSARHAESVPPAALKTWTKAPFATGSIPVVSMLASVEMNVSFRRIGWPARSAIESLRAEIGTSGGSVVVEVDVVGTVVVVGSGTGGAHTA